MQEKKESKLSKILSKIHSNPKSIRLKYGSSKTVFTNGCFDILHVGHITYLAKAADMGERLIVGVNDDDSVKRLGKGKNRPVNDQNSRALLIASLDFVSAVIIFKESTPLNLIKELKPNVLVKGGDYSAAETNPENKKYIVGSDLVTQNGGEVKTINLVDGFSTTSIIQRMNKD